ncbi:MAG TPA: TCAD7 domain-containing protein, partial [Isosphaeraceae bacterium]|nr:TCAD7 domain-containing protein [Isosphaeraceae bacterium]
MYLHEVASDSYVLLQASWTVCKARELVEHLNPTHVIVHHSKPTDFYYLYTKSEARGRLATHDAQTTLFDALNLHEYTATPTRDAFAPADEVPDRAVVMEEGRVVGFFDATVPPTERGTRGGDGQPGYGGV